MIFAIDQIYIVDKKRKRLGQSVDGFIDDELSNVSLSSQDVNEVLVQNILLNFKIKIYDEKIR